MDILLLFYECQLSKVDFMHSVVLWMTREIKWLL